jgi:ABC-type Fe3+-hydroxamate transport system substrate-binding protein
LGENNMNIAIFNRELGVYLLYGGNHYRKTIQTLFALNNKIVVIPIPSKSTISEEKLNLIKNARGK